MDHPSQILTGDRTYLRPLTAADRDPLITMASASRRFHSPWATAPATAAAFAAYLMTEGLRLTLKYAFKVLKLHRVEANIQPGNVASIKLVRRCGFTREGFSPRYLKIGGRWRDHERWAVRADNWRPDQAQRRHLPPNR
jgi:[ribosomal protein S5]-alanine N-acetyltransferase